VHRDPVISTATAGEPLASIKEQELQPPHRGEKRGSWYHKKNPTRGNISSIPLSEEHCWCSRKKNNLKTPYQRQGHKRLKP
jgi:hypothetical protein